MDEEIRLSNESLEEVTAKSKATIDELQNNFDESRDEVAALRNALSDTRGNIEALEEGLSTALLKLEESQQREQESEAKVLALEKALTEARNYAGGLLAKSKQMADEFDHVSRKAVESEMEVTELLMKLEEKDEETPESSGSSNSMANIRRVQRMLKQKAADNEELRKELEQLRNDYTTQTACVEELEEERAYVHAKNIELSQLINVSDENTVKRLLQEKSVQCIELSKERSTMRRKLNAFSEQVEMLEAECRAKALLVEEVTQKHGSTVRSGVDLERLKQENKISVRRTKDLSLQLSESQMRIDQLTEELRLTKK